MTVDERLNAAGEVYRATCDAADEAYFTARRVALAVASEARDVQGLPEQEIEAAFQIAVQDAMAIHQAVYLAAGDLHTEAIRDAVAGA